MAQIFNFSSGPAMLPAEVLKQAQQELRDWNGLGTSVMEVSHRGKGSFRLQRKPRRIFAIFLTSPPTTKYCSAMAAVAVSLLLFR
ncbi:Phosphohydroxythreonine aminotransferase [Escherichia coli]|nr:Phosphohydroxythreonine aminotransferase [Escherichia coli]